MRGDVGHTLGALLGPASTTSRQALTNTDKVEDPASTRQLDTPNMQMQAVLS